MIWGNCYSNYANDDIDAWNATPVMEQEALERLETVMETAGELQHDQWVDFSKLVDNRFAESAK